MLLFAKRLRNDQWSFKLTSKFDLEEVSLSLPQLCSKHRQKTLPVAISYAYSLTQAERNL